MTAERRRPSIFQVGRVFDIGGVIHLQGWGLGQCLSGCRCHFHPANGQLYLLEDQVNGRIGLRSFINGWCSCCQPWTAAELLGLLHDLATINHLETA